MTEMTVRVKSPSIDLGELEGDEMSQVFEAIAAEVASGGAMGSAQLGLSGHRFDWEIEHAEPSVALDPRQRRAAAFLLMAVDLPQELGAFARTMLEAARVAPGMTMGDMGEQSRINCLRMAKGLIDEMLAEVSAEATPA